MKTIINAPIDKCFDLSRNIDLHLQSMSNSKEKAIAGKTNGLIDLGESVTWEAEHFGLKLRLATKITKMEKPLNFTDEMKRGPFKFMKHLHRFDKIGDKTEMIDVFEFGMPFGFMGWLVEELLLKIYMKKLLTKRNMVIKQFAENKKT
ncbi:SRPBCC family protein [Pedobacter mendelii]|uniref:Cell division protein n=1 Tax=Pedobacter mendelii TaxID=1908240 RepID=A0ABQ2BMI6_9SPHI|nr:SRPBCC family protein [Pedobacter mendelii]GGI28143.1 hypothetical protein GCM10008119_31170 [Pedobacter mendelii]